MSSDHFQFSFNNDESSEIKTMVLVTYTDMSGLLAFVIGGAPTAEELAKMMADGAFGPDAAEIVGSATAFAEQFADMLEGGFSDAMMEGLGFDVPALTSVLESFGSTPPSSEDAFGKALASRENWAMEDYTTEGVVLILSGEAVKAGLIVTEYAPGQAKLVGLALIGLGAAGIWWSADSASEKRAKEKEGDQSSTDPKEDPEDPEEIAKEDESGGSDDDDKEEVASKDDEPQSDEATTTPKDPTVDGSGAANGTPPPEDEQEGGDRDPEEEVFIFVLSEPSAALEDQLSELILTDPETYYAELPDIDPNMIEELTQPGPDGDGQAIIFIFG